MTQQIADALQGHPPAQQVNCVGMANAVDALKWNVEAALLGPSLKSLDHRCRFQRATWRTKAQKDLPVAAVSRYFPQIVADRGTHRTSERQLKEISGFTLANPKVSIAPQNVLQLERYDIARTQAVAGH